MVSLGSPKLIEVESPKLIKLELPNLIYLTSKTLKKALQSLLIAIDQS